MIVGRLDFFVLGFGDVEADRFEQDVQVGVRAERLEEARGVEAVGAEVVDHRPAAIEQGLDVDQFEGPDPFVEHATARGEARGRSASASRAHSRSSGPAAQEDPGGAMTRASGPDSSARDSTSSRTSPSSLPRCVRITTCWPRSYPAESAQNLSHSGHQAISDQIRTFHIDPLRPDLVPVHDLPG